MRSALVLSFGLIAGCDWPGDCVQRNLSAWCYHDEAGEREVPADPDCPSPSMEDAILSEDGRFLVTIWSGGFTGMSHYFDADTGEHVATSYTSDVNTYCGGFDYWYGQRLTARISLEGAELVSGASARQEP